MIKKLKLTNFTCFENAEFTFDKINFIIGPNGSGKTSIADAILFTLTNQCPRIDKYINELITINKNYLQTQLDFYIKNNLFSLKRIRIRNEIRPTEFQFYKNNQLMQIPNQKELNNVLANLFGLNPEFLNYKYLLKYSYFKTSSSEISFYELFQQIFSILQETKLKLLDLIKKYENETIKINNQISNIEGKLEILKSFNINKKITQIDYEKLNNELQHFKQNLNQVIYQLAEIKQQLSNYDIILKNSTCPIFHQKCPISNTDNIKSDYNNLIQKQNEYLSIKSELESKISELNSELTELNKQLEYQKLIEKENPQQLSQLLAELNNLLTKISEKIRILNYLNKNYSIIQSTIFSKIINSNQSLIYKITQDLFDDLFLIEVEPATNLILYLIRNNKKIQFENLSTSEKIKVNLTLMFLILNLFGEISSPFYIFDEIFDHLDTANFKKIINYFVLKYNSNKQIFIITHRINEIHLTQKNINIIQL